MMRCVLDTNIIVDCLAQRKPYCDSAQLLVMLGRVHEFELWIGLSQLSDVIYLLSEGGKKSRMESVKRSLKWLLEEVRLCSLDEPSVNECLNSDWDDLEDALVYQAARSIGADAIITRNQKDFKRSNIPVFDCDEFFAWLRDSKGVNYDYIEL